MYSTVQYYTVSGSEVPNDGEYSKVAVSEGSGTYSTVLYEIEVF